VSHPDALLKTLAGEIERAVKHSHGRPVHDLRISIRRFLQYLETFGRSYPSDKARKISRRLKKIMNLAGRVRDRDIALRLLQHAGIQRNAPVCKMLSEERKEAERDLRRYLEHQARRKLLKSSVNVPAAATVSARRKLLSQVRSYFETGRKFVGVKASEKELHRLRIKTKRLRYTLELFRRRYGPRLERYLETLRRIQQHLGAINDCAVTAQLVDRALPRRSAAGRKLDEFLSRQIKLEKMRLHRYWRTHFDSPGEERRWIQYLSRGQKRVPK
jgi:CHAD domain-containing protein